MRLKDGVQKAGEIAGRLSPDQIDALIELLPKLDRKMWRKHEILAKSPAYVALVRFFMARSK